MGTELATSRPKNQVVSILDRTGDPMEAIERAGKWIADSKLFGAKNEQQGMMLAWSMLVSNRDPLEVNQEYHLISGNFSMKYRKQVANFQKAGGKMKVLSRTPKLAKAELSFHDTTAVFEFSIDDAISEPYMWTSAANDNPKIKKIIDGKINNLACKDNWSTERRRMQMLWARMMTDGIAAIAPMVTDGSYADAEFDSWSGDNPTNDPIDAEFTIIEKPADEVTIVDTPKPETQDKPTTLEAAVQTATAKQRMATKEQLDEIKRLKDVCNLSGASWKETLAHYNVASARDLTFDAADDLSVILLRESEQQRLAEDQKGFFTGQADETGLGPQT